MFNRLKRDIEVIFVVLRNLKNVFFFLLYVISLYAIKILFISIMCINAMNQIGRQIELKLKIS